MDAIDSEYAPITDRASTFGFNSWTKLCKKRDKKPIYGVEIAVSPEITAKKVTRSHFTFIATESLTNLNRLVARSTEQFRFEPLLSYQDLAMIPHDIAILPGRNAILRHLDPDRPNLFIPHGPSTPSTHLDWAAEKGVTLMASGDNFYPQADDRETYEVLCGRGAT